MIVGDSRTRAEDLEREPAEGEEADQHARGRASDDATLLAPPVRFKMTLEERDRPIINDDELVEVTPESIRLRKRWLDPHERKKQSRKQAVA